MGWDGMAREKEAPILEEHPQREIFVVCCSSDQFRLRRQP